MKNYARSQQFPRRLNGPEVEELLAIVTGRVDRPTSGQDGHIRLPLTFPLLLALSRGGLSLLALQFSPFLSIGLALCGYTFILVY